MKLPIKADLTTIKAPLIRLSKQLDKNQLHGVLSDIGKRVENSTRHRIAVSKTAPDGTPWASLKDSTLAVKYGNRRTSAAGINRGVLVEFGNLLKSMTHRTDTVKTVVGSVMVYAPFLQEGTKNMVARPFLGLSNEDNENIGDLLARWLAGEFS